jgi:hypothetical protein
MSDPYELLKQIINDPTDVAEILVFCYNDINKFKNNQQQHDIMNIITFEGGDNFMLNDENIKRDALLKQIDRPDFGYIVKITVTKFVELDDDGPVFERTDEYQCYNTDSKIYEKHLIKCATRIQRDVRQKRINDVTPPHGKKYLEMLEKYKSHGVSNSFGKRKNARFTLKFITSSINYVKKC